MSGGLDVRPLGLVEYGDGLRLQAAFRSARAEGRGRDTLFLVEHPPVITLGRKGQAADVIETPAGLEARGIEVVETDRGGEGTYHGPGQLVGYPVIHLEGRRRDVRRYVRDLEETMIRAAADFGVAAGRVEGLIGVWLGADAVPASDGPSRKLGAIGVHLARWVTSHGFALNVSTDLSAFELLVPCGIRDRGMTSLARELGQAVSFEAVTASAAKRFGEVFADQWDEPAAVLRPDQQTVQVQIARRGPAGPELLALRRVPVRGGFWQPITGRVERGESPAQAAQRELGEEIGCQTPVASLDYRHAFLWSTQRLTTTEETVFWALPEEGFVPALSDEHDAFEWLPWRAASARYPFPGLKRGARLAAERLS